MIVSILDCKSMNLFAITHTSRPFRVYQLLIYVSTIVPVAAVVYNNPQGVKYEAEFTKESTVTGSVFFEATNNGTGITVTVDLANFPSAGGPFLYVSFSMSYPRKDLSLMSIM